MDNMYKKYTMILDTETTGLQNSYPTQISYILVTFDPIYNIEKTVNKYIQLPSNIVLSSEVTDITGITRAMCDSGDVEKDVLKEFCDDYLSCHMIVVHNYEFDIKCLFHAIQRNWEMLKNTHPNALVLFDPIYMKENGISYHCTMKSNIERCKLPFAHSLDFKRKQRKGFKYPKLEELYIVLFNQKPKHLHNAMMDILVTLRCFYKTVKQKDIVESEFQELIFKYITHIDH